VIGRGVSGAIATANRLALLLALETLSGALKSNLNPVRTGLPNRLPFSLVLRLKSGTSEMMYIGVGVGAGFGVGVGVGVRMGKVLFELGLLAETGETLRPSTPIRSILMPHPFGCS
jgi:hypothetical protein